MKAEQREVYRVLSDEIGYLICSFCRYHDFSGTPCSDGGEYGCNHPLEGRIGCPEIRDMVPGQDCWMFLADYPPEVAADIVGTFLSEGYVGNTEWNQMENGFIEVIGLRRS